MAGQGSFNREVAAKLCAVLKQSDMYKQLMQMITSKPNISPAERDLIKFSSLSFCGIGDVGMHAEILGCMIDLDEDNDQCGDCV